MGFDRKKRKFSQISNDDENVVIFNRSHTMAVMCSDVEYFIQNLNFTKELYIGRNLEVKNLESLPPATKKEFDTIFDLLKECKDDDKDTEFANLIKNIDEILKILSSNILQVIQKNRENIQILKEVFNFEEISLECRDRDVKAFEKRLKDVLDLLSKNCCQARDSEIQNLTKCAYPSITFLQDLFQFILNMRIDLVNYYLKSLKEVLFKSLIENERKIINQKVPTDFRNLVNTRDYIKKAIEGLRIDKDNFDKNLIDKIILEAQVLCVSGPDDKIMEIMNPDLLRISIFKSFVKYSALIASSLNLLKTHIKNLEPFDDLIELKIAQIALKLNLLDLRSKEKLLETGESMITLLEGKCQEFKISCPDEAFKSHFLSLIQNLEKQNNEVVLLFEKRIKDVIFCDSDSNGSLTEPHPSIKCLKETLMDFRNVFKRYLTFNKIAFRDIYTSLIMDTISD